MLRLSFLSTTACALLLAAGCGSVDNQIGAGSPPSAPESTVPSQSVPDSEIQAEDEVFKNIDWHEFLSMPNPYTPDGAGGSLCWAGSALGRLGMTVQLVPEEYDGAALGGLVSEIQAQLELAGASEVMDDPMAAEWLRSSSGVVDELSNAVRRGATSAEQISEIMKDFDTPSRTTGSMCPGA